MLERNELASITTDSIVMKESSTKPTVLVLSSLFFIAKILPKRKLKFPKKLLLEVFNCQKGEK